LTLSFITCDKEPKETTINGVVLDKYTGEPIPGASVSFRISKNSIQNPTTFEYVTTSQMGQFNFISIEPVYIYDVTKIGYLSKNSNPGIPQITQAKENNVEILMTPTDGVLRLNISNSTNAPGIIYFGVYSPSLDLENFLSKGIAIKDSLLIGPFDTKTQILNLASENSVGVYWGLSSLPFDIKTLPFHEFVSIIRNDTTNFTISF
jgi:hypothetical protein